jgi:di/tricarboxylate transporter
MSGVLLLVDFMVIVAQGTSIWYVGIQTAAAQNLLTVGFMDKMLGQRVSWVDWFIAGAPWAIIMSIVLVVIVLNMLPPPKKPAAVSGLLILGWATVGKLHAGYRC